jgi:cyclophilin family peptidyl-prolyl cis-trans isomerase
MNTLSKRTFSAIYNYSNAANPRVFLSVAAGQHKIGDLVFELYEDKQPATVENFKVLLKGTSDGKSYIGSHIEKGMAGLGVIAGRIDSENNSAYGVWQPDGNLNLRHLKRGLLTTTSEGPNRVGGEFMITFNEAAFLDGYQTVFGELVEGEAVLAEIEKHVDRHGKVNGDLSIIAGGQK